MAPYPNSASTPGSSGSRNEPVIERYEVILSEGLDGQDDNFDTLNSFWEELQLCTIETAHPQLDMVSFSMNCFYFAVVMLKPVYRDTGRSSSNSQYVRKHSGSWDTAVSISRYVGMDPDPSQLGLFSDIISRTDLDEVTPTTTTFSQNNGFEIPPPPYYQGLTQYRLVPSQHNPLFPAQYPEAEYITHTESPIRPIGIVYLTATPLNCPHDQVGELNIGIILDKAVRGNGYGRDVVQRVLTTAFEDKKCHRVQAAILNTMNKDVSMTLFTQMKFSHEGVRRSCYFSQFEQEWKDVTYLALLDTDWVNRIYLRPAPKTLWDEMFARHAREREELLRWEENRMKLKRSSSLETVLPHSVEPAPSVSGNESDYQSASEAESSAGLRSPFGGSLSKRRKGNGENHYSSSEAEESDADTRALLDRSRTHIHSSQRWSPARSTSSSSRGSPRPQSPAQGVFSFAIGSSRARSPTQSDSSFDVSSPRPWSPALSTSSDMSVPHTISSISDVDSPWETSTEWDMIETSSEASVEN